MTHLPHPPLVQPGAAPRGPHSCISARLTFEMKSLTLPTRTRKRQTQRNFSQNTGERCCSAQTLTLETAEELREADERSWKSKVTGPSLAVCGTSGSKGVKYFGKITVLPTLPPMDNGAQVTWTRTKNSLFLTNSFVSFLFSMGDHGVKGKILICSAN